LIAAELFNRMNAGSSGFLFFGGYNAVSSGQGMKRLRSPVRIGARGKVTVKMQSLRCAIVSVF
jgi:hypothetical protein